MMAKRQRAKGVCFERWVVNKFRPLFPDAIRVLEYQGGRGFDVNAGPFRIQCKKHRSYVPINKINEVPDAAKGIKALVTAGDYRPAMIVLKLDDFLGLIEKMGK